MARHNFSLGAAIGNNGVSGSAASEAEAPHPLSLPSLKSKPTKFASSSRRMRRLGAAVLPLALLGTLSCLSMSNRLLDLEAAPEVRRALRVARRYTRRKAPLPAAVQPAQPAEPAAVRRPNVIYIQHESLSGSLMLNTAQGQASTPFLQGRMGNDPDFYVFEHQRTGSGITIDALPAMMTGCLPFTEQGIEYAHAKGRSVGYEFKDRGYHTASFSSRELDETLKEGKWSMLYDLLVGGMDRVEDARHSRRIKLDNGQGSSDRQMLPLFEEWLAELEGKEGDAPFYAQFYNFNQHFPYLKKTGNSRRLEGLQYYESLKATDMFLEAIFDILSRTGQLENTIIVGSGDHGEDPFKKQYARLAALTPSIMHAAAYVHYPRHLMPEGEMAERLRRNTQRLTYTLDMHSLVRSALHGGPTDAYLGHLMSDPHSASSLGCIGGIDPASVEIPEDRVVLSINLASSQKVHTRPLQLWGISTRDKTLYHRTGKYAVPPLVQGRHSEYVFLYGDCTQLVDQLCTMELNSEMQEYFRRAIVNLRKYNRGFVGEEVKTSKLVEFFVLILGGEGAMESTENDMEFESSHESSTGMEHQYSAGEVTMAESTIATFKDVAHQEVTKPVFSDPSSEVPFSKGSISAGITDDFTFDHPPVSGWKEPSCKNILIYMPEMPVHPSIEMQLRNYILAALVATFTNLSMVILDAPQEEGDTELNSQFGCPRGDEMKPPPGLSRLVKAPEWLTCGCAVPCQKSHSYSDWDDLRRSSKGGIPETVCTNDNGQQSNVYVVSASEISGYFEKHFKLPMLQRPSLVAYDWALRLGANSAEAKAFYRLSGEGIWDYLGALVARSDLIKFQPWILNDAEHYIQKLEFPVIMPSVTEGMGAGKKTWLGHAPVNKEGMGAGETWPFDAVHVRRGEELLTAPEAREFIFNYWDARGGYHGKHMNSIPLVHYLRHYHYQCSEETRKIYVATGDPEGVSGELVNFSEEIDGGQHKIGCNTFRFKFLEGYRGMDTCTAGYSKTIANITDFIIFIKVQTLVGDFNSDWGKLIRTFRLKLNRETTSNGDEIKVSLPGTEVAWGTMPPAMLPDW